MASRPRVWIDLANSPHVPLFAPIARELETLGAAVLWTSRAFAQTEPLRRRFGIDARAIGGHGGGSRAGKALALARRARGLADAVAGRADLAVGHNSYAQAIAALRCGMPYVTMMDFEGTPANHLAFRVAREILLPEAIPLGAVRRFGAHEGKVARYPGFKEQVYLDGFRPDPGALPPDLVAWLESGRVRAAARPPAEFAVYHPRRLPPFETWLRDAATRPGVRIVVLPRTDAQRARIEALDLPRVRIPREAVDGAQLVAASDLVVSAGGTMNREAAVLGIPAYSLFAGPLPAVDRDLVRRGRLERIRGEDDLERIRLVPKPAPEALDGEGLARRVAEWIAGHATR